MGQDCMDAAEMWLCGWRCIEFKCDSTIPELQTATEEGFTVKCNPLFTVNPASVAVRNSGMAAPGHVNHSCSVFFSVTCD